MLVEGGSVIKDNMPSFSATMPRLIVILLFEDVMLLDLAGPLQMFQMAGGYRIIALSQRGGLVASDCSIALDSRSWESAAPPSDIDTLLIPGGYGALAASGDPAMIDIVQRLSPLARRTASVCLGAFVLAAAGLLDGRKAATHWHYCADLAQRFPQVTVESEPIFVHDGPIWTSAGVTAGIDLALAMVEQDQGRDLAREVAQRAVVFLQRPGGQAQFSRALAAQTTDRDARFADLSAWMLANLATDLSVEALAARCAMAPRSFARVFAARMGATPAKHVERLRVEAARQRLEQADETVATIAQRCGFGDDERMRRAFMRSLGISPTDYRARFGAAEDHIPSARRYGRGS